MGFNNFIEYSFKESNLYAITFSLQLGYINNNYYNYYNNSHDQIIKSFYNNLKCTLKSSIHVDLVTNDYHQTKFFIVTLLLLKNEEFEKLKKEISVAWYKTLIDYSDVDFNWSKARVDQIQYRDINKNDRSYGAIKISIIIDKSDYTESFLIDGHGKLNPHIFSDRHN